MRFIFSFVLLFGLLINANAQDNEAVQSFEQSLNGLRNNIFNGNRKNSSKTISPYYYRLIDPEVYSASAIKGMMTLEDLEGDKRDQINHFIDKSLVGLYLKKPSAVAYSDLNINQEQSVPVVKEDEPIVLPVEKVDDILNNELEVKQAKDIDDNIVDIGLKVEKPNFWKFTGKASLQFTQNYFSDNWYKGGNNNQNLLASLILQANYDDQKRLSWENKLEMRLGFMTTPSDTCHKFLTSNDKLNLYSKLGLKAKKAWFYTATAEANTQFMPGYRSNNRLKFSNFLAPFDVYFSIGMDFKPSLKNGNTFSLALLPFSYKMRWLNDKDDNIHRVYNMVDEDITHDFGSKLEMNCKFQIAKDFFWKSRLYCYSAYDYVEAEWENIFTYAFSKYINAEVFTLWRFDDNRDRKYYDEHLGYFQFKEYFTLGLTYAF
jgi:hypothetical protein